MGTWQQNECKILHPKSAKHCTPGQKSNFRFYSIVQLYKPIFVIFQLQFC